MVKTCFAEQVTRLGHLFSFEVTICDLKKRQKSKEMVLFTFEVTICDLKIVKNLRKYADFHLEVAICDFKMGVTLDGDVQFMR